jgi:aminoglycoside/choline kinase family phosphotransferase
MRTDTQEVPRSLEAVQDPVWLSKQLSPLKGGSPVTSIEVVELIQINATKIRFIAHFENGESDAFCLKGFLDEPVARPNVGSVREVQFYTEIAPRLPLQVPECVAAPIDRQSEFGIIVMRDLIVEGAYFCSALEPFDANRTSKSLEQLAKLHHSQAYLGPIAEIEWLPRQIDWLSGIMPLDILQPLMHDQRSVGMPERVRDGALLLQGMKALSAMDAKHPVCLLHGDCHAGNFFDTASGTGVIDFQLLQQGGWALDVAYHIAAVLPVGVAERSERALLKH